MSSILNDSRLKNRLVFGDYSEYMSICGIDDSHIRVIESLIGSVIYLKGNEIIIEGSDRSVSQTNLKNIDEIFFQQFNKKDIVRHNLVGKILDCYDSDGV